MKKEHRMSRFFVLMLCLSLVISVFTLTSFAADYVPDGSVAVFATDRHDNTEIIPQLLEKMYADGNAPGLIALGGDSVGNGPNIESNANYAPIVDTAVIQGEVYSVLSPEVRLAVLMASHDENMTDSAGVLIDTAGGFECGEYYVYIVPEAYMDNEEAAAAAAEEFVLWAESDEVDANKPLIVLSHMPIHYLREDNLGGAVWHDAINRVATAGGEEMVRNLIFFHGHNHTVDSEEYYYPAESSIAIQGMGDDGQSEDPIHYTYITAGYLNANGTATLLRVEEEQIVVDKYTVDGATELGTIVRLMPESGNTGLIIAAGAAVLVVVIVAAVVLVRRKSQKV